MRSIGLGLLLALSASPQFNDLAVTDDGRLYFWTTHRLAGQSAQSNGFKIVRLTGEGFELVAQAPIHGGAASATVTAPFVSGDGAIYGYSEFGGCLSPGPGCMARGAVKLTGAQFPPMRPPQSGHISRNGRFFIGNNFPSGVVWIDLETGRTTEPVTLRPAYHNRSIANDGTALLVVESSDGSGSLYQRREMLLAYHPDRGLSPVDGGRSALSASISPDARWIAIERVADQTGERELVLRDTSSGETRTLARMPIRAPRLDPYLNGTSNFHPTFSNNGTLLYLEYDSATTLRQLAVLDPGGQPRRLPNVAEGVKSAIIAGGGHTAYAVTTLNRLLRVDPIALTVEELLPPTPQISGDPAPPGSAVRALASGVTKDTEIRIGETRAPVTQVDSRFAFFQIPWEATPVQRAPMVARMAGNPFEWVSTFTIEAAPGVRIDSETYGDGLEFFDIPQIAHQDFRGVVSLEDPARPGEILHVFATKLGPVDQPQRTGVPAPASPLARITTPFACYLSARFSQERVEGAVLPYVGLTPGSTGIYQIDLTIPSDWTSELAVIECVNDKGARDFAQISIRR